MKRYFASTWGEGLKPFTIGFVGWADYRGAAAYNTKLSERRAVMVKEAFDEHFLGPLSTPFWRQRYSSILHGAGEGKERNALSLHKDRRVDIVSSRTYESRLEFPGTKIELKPKSKELSRQFEIRTRFGIQVSMMLGAALLKIEIRNRRNGKTIKLEIAGPAGSAGPSVGLNRPTEFAPFDTPYYLELTDFAGRGEVSGISVGVAGASNLMFYGPVDYGLAPKHDVLLGKPLVVKTSGWDLNVGLGGMTGVWEVTH
jgi:hypothetical protein